MILCLYILYSKHTWNQILQPTVHFPRFPRPTLRLRGGDMNKQVTQDRTIADPSHPWPRASQTKSLWPTFLPTANVHHCASKQIKIKNCPISSLFGKQIENSDACRPPSECDKYLPLKKCLGEDVRLASFQGPSLEARIQDVQLLPSRKTTKPRKCNKLMATTATMEMSWATNLLSVQSETIQAA